MSSAKHGLLSLGVLMDRRILYFSLLSLSLAACSNMETRKQAQGDFDYVNIEQDSKLTIPDNLSRPESHELYTIPAPTNLDGAVGIEVDVRAPALALPTANGSRIDEFDKTAAIWYDKVDDNRDLNALVGQAVSDYMTSNNVEIVNQNPENHEWESGWFESQTESGSWFWKSIDSTEAWRYKYSLVTKPHGRSVGLNVELVDYKFTSQNKSESQIDQIEKARVEMAMVNAITTELSYIYRVNNREDRIARANLQLVNIGESEQGEPALIIDYPPDELWIYISGFFEKYGFRITDLNEDKRIYEVYYTKPDNSFWDSLWGDEVPVIEMENGTYEFHLKELGKKTAMVIVDEQNNPVSEKILLDNFDILDPALSFKE